MNKVHLFFISLLFIFFIHGKNDLLKKNLKPTRELSTIGRKIWHNEGAGKRENLVCWNRGENWASVGIGHFIWYPKDQQGSFEETFPAFMRFAQKRGRKLPAFVVLTKDFSCPWRHRGEFMTHRHDTEMIQLRNFLENTLDLQIQFIAKRLLDSLPYILAACPDLDCQQRVNKYITELSSTSSGLYCLLDYCNFKGAGTNPSERYCGKGWGLVHVLVSIDDAVFNENPTQAFADAAARIINERVQLAPSERLEERWLPGWQKRIATYIPL